MVPQRAKLMKLHFRQPRINPHTMTRLHMMLPMYLYLQAARALSRSLTL